MIVMEYSELLSEVVIDNFHFRVTWSPIQRACCILWFRDEHASRYFEALGQFSHFDKRKVLDFIVRYTVNPALREEIDLRRFERRIENLPADFFRRIEQLSQRNRELAYRNLFNLDTIIDPELLSRRRRIMAKKFHPDAGGSQHVMTLINEAYDFLAQRKNVQPAAKR